MDRAEAIQKRADEIAAELALLRAEQADPGSREARAALTDAYDRALSSAREADRTDLAIAVEDRFEDAATLAAVAVPTGDPRVHAARLVRLAPVMDESTRRDVGTRLGAAGLAPPDASGGATLSEGIAAVRRALGEPDDATLDPARALVLLGLMLPPLLAVDSIAWRTWRAMAPDSRFRRAGELRDAAAAYLAGGDEAPDRPAIETESARLRQLVAALLAAVSRAGEAASSRLAVVLPERIEPAARAERKWNESEAVACWRKYQELAKALDPATLDGLVVEAMVEYAEELIEAGAAPRTEGAA